MHAIELLSQVPRGVWVDVHSHQTHVEGGLERRGVREDGLGDAEDRLKPGARGVDLGIEDGEVGRRLWSSASPGTKAVGCESAGAVSCRDVGRPRQTALGLRHGPAHQRLLCSELVPVR